MKEARYSNYATNKGGKIESPRTQKSGEPKASVRKGDDLRATKSKSSK